MPTLAFIHTVPSLAPTFRSLQEKHLPDWQSYHVADESLLQNTIRTGVLSRKTMQRLAQYVFSAEQAGADAIVVTCSTLGEAVETIQPLCEVPLFRIDLGMAHEAIDKGGRIGVLATLPTTLGPTSRMIANVAKSEGKTVEIRELLCEGAFEKLMGGDREGHDTLVLSGYRDLLNDVDVIVLAQASMANVLSSVRSDDGVSVLSSPDLGMARIARELAS